MKPLQFWFEFGSTYSYPAAMRVERLAQQRGIALSWQPFLLGPIFHDQGWDDSPFNIYPAKGAYMWRDLERVCGAEGITFRRPSVFPRSGLLAARVVCAAGTEAWIPEFVRAVYQANFVHDQDISDATVIRRCLTDLGQDADRRISAAASRASKEALRNQTEQARKLGFFGAPSFVVGEEVFWGNDRLEAALDWCVCEGES